MLKAFIFDVDGTLLDTERIYMRAWQDAAAELGYVMSMELLAFLQKKGIRLAVASSTNTKTTKEHLAINGIADWFEVIVGGDMIEKGKPNPDIFLKAAELLGEAPEECVVVEDSPAGIRAGAAAGMKTVLVPDQAEITREIIDLSNIVLKSLLEMPAYVEELLK